MIGDAYRRTNHNEEAISLYNYIIDSYPDADYAMWSQMGIAISEIALRDFDAADEATQKLRENYSEHPSIYNAIQNIADNYRWRDIQPEKARDLYDLASEGISGPDSIWTHMGFAIESVRIADFDTSDIVTAWLITDFGDNESLPQVVNLIGDAYCEADKFDSASKLYEYAINTWPDDPQTIYAEAGIAKVAVNLGLDEEANQIIDEIFVDYADNPNLDDAIFGIGEEYWKLAQSERRKDNPMAVPPQILPAKQEVVISDKTKDYYTNAQNIWEKIIQDMPSSSMAYQAYRYAAEACKIIGQNDKAIEYFQAVVDNWPDDDIASHCLNMIADVYRTVQDSGALSQSEAESRMKQVYELLATDYPDSAPGLYAKGWLSLYKANETARQRYEKVKKLNSTKRSGTVSGSMINNSNEGAEQ